MTLGDKITLLREKAGLTESELAAKVGVAKKTLLRWERGELMPDIQKIVMLAELFSVSTDSLLIDSVDPQKDDGAVQNKPRRHVSVREAGEYIAAKFRAAYSVAIATFIMILAPGVMLTVMALPFPYGRLDAIVGLASFFLLATVSVSIYLRTYVKTSRFDYVSLGDFSLDYGAIDMLTKTEERVMLSYAVRNTAAIILCISSFVPLIVVALISHVTDLTIMISIASSLFLAGLGVTMFIVSGMKRAALFTLRGTRGSERTYSKQLEEKIDRGFWVLVICFYLLYSYVSNNWHLSWLIFVFAAGISSLISAAFTLVRRANGDDKSGEE